LSMKKRIFALAAAAVAALALGGVNLAGHAGTARADGPSGGMAVGCVNILGGTASTAIQFNASTLQQVATPATTGSPSNVDNNFYLTTPGNYLQCGVVLQGSSNIVSGNPALNPQPNPFIVSCTGTTSPISCTASFTDNDGNANTVDVGTVTYSLANAGGRFVILDNNSTTITLTCNTGASSVFPNGIEGCTGANTSTTSGQITPNPALVVKVGLAPGVPLSAFGALPAAGFSFNLQATYTRTAPSSFQFTYSCTGDGTNCVVTSSSVPYTGGAATPVFFGDSPSYTGTNANNCITATNVCNVTVTVNSSGPATATAMVNLNLVAPTYGMYMTANPSTIPATPPSGGAVASGAAGGGSTITAVLYTATGLPPQQGVSISIAPGAITPTAPIPGQACTVVTYSGVVLTCGVEPGTVTFQTNLGVFGSPATPSASGQQTVSVACGVLPGSSLTGVVYNPATFGFGTLSFSSCQTASTTLYGGGSAGTATVVGTFVGAITGQTAQYSIAVAIAPTPASLSLTRGCNEVITPASLAAGSNVNAVVNGVSPSSAVVSVWQYNNATQKFNALYFNNPQAPVDQNTVGPSQSVFICVSGAATYATGAY